MVHDRQIILINFDAIGLESRTLSLRKIILLNISAVFSADIGKV